MRNSFHGRTFGALSATGQKRYHDGFEPLLDGFAYAKFNDIKDIESLLASGQYCAVLVEPIQGEGGVNIADKNYIKQLRELTLENNILLILDEVQVGLGRTGKLFAYMNFDIEPDIMTLAKPLAGGLPIGAVLAKESVARAFEPGSHASTFGGGPLVLSASNAFFDEIVKNGFLDDVLEKGRYIATKLRGLKERFPKLIKDVRTIGLISAIEFYDLRAKDIAVKLIENGFLTTTVQDKVIRLTPPLIISKSEIDSIIKSISLILKNDRIKL